jgi:hypothetical protein
MTGVTNGTGFTTTVTEHDICKKRCKISFHHRYKTFTEGVPYSNVYIEINLTMVKLVNLIQHVSLYNGDTDKLSGKDINYISV